MRRSTLSKLIIFQIYYNIIVKFLINDLGMPKALNYVTDVITIAILVGVIVANKEGTLKLRYIYLLIIAYMAEGILSAFCNSVDVLLIIWAIRNVGRFFAWLYVVSEVFTDSDFEKLFRGLHTILYVNLAVIIFQYVVLGTRQDNLNGLFGTYVGGNSAVNTFCVVLTIEDIAAYLTQKRNAKQLLWNIAVMCVTCALNELKFYYIELVLIAAVAMLVLCGKRIPQKILQRGTAAILFLMFVAVAGYGVLTAVYPGFKDFFTKESLSNYLTRSYNSYTIIYHNGIPISNRLSAYGIVRQYFLIDPFKMLFGLGMGICEHSSFFSGVFYNMYGPIAIHGYSLPLVLLENGIVGAFLFVWIFIHVFRISKRKIKLGSVENYRYIISGTAALVGILICIYNSALRIESSGYLYYTVLAMVFVGGNHERNYKTDDIRGKI